MDLLIASTAERRPVSDDTRHVADDLATIGDLANLRDVAATIRESATHVLTVALLREGIIASPEKIARLAKEIGANASQLVGMLAVEVTL